MKGIKISVTAIFLIMFGVSLYLRISSSFVVNKYSLNFHLNQNQKTRFKNVARSVLGSPISTILEGEDPKKPIDEHQEEGEKPWIFTAPRGYQESPLGGGYMEEVELTIETLTNTGSGLGRLEGGWVVMVPHTIPGEKVKVGIHRNYNNYSEATLLEVIEPALGRVDPPCQHFGVCGGCQYQHMSIETQRDWKRRQVEEVLQKLGGITFPVNEVFGTDNIYGYRSKLTPHYDIPREGEDPAIGFQRMTMPTVYHLIKRNTDLFSIPRQRLLDIDECKIATDAINERLKPLREETVEKVRKQMNGELPIETKKKKKGRKKFAGRPQGATLLLRDTLHGVETDQKKDVYEKVEGLTFEFKAGEFFQNNPYVLPHMISHVLNKAQAPGVTHLIDAYCGGGLFCLSASPRFEQCAGIEISEASIESAKKNAELNGLKNCKFLAGTAANIFANVTFPASETSIIIDPPRKGCDQQFLDQLFAFNPARVVYVSCDPATQARDAKSFIEAGYSILDVQPFDLFPQTRHIENVITFDAPAKSIHN